MSMNNEHQRSDTPTSDQLDQEIRLAMQRGVHEPHADFTRELMSVIAEEELAPMKSPALSQRLSPQRLSWTLVAVGVIFLVIALLIPGNSVDGTSFKWTSSSMWTVVALGLISLLAMTQSKPRFRGL